MLQMRGGLLVGASQRGLQILVEPADHFTEEVGPFGIWFSWRPEIWAMLPAWNANQLHRHVRRAQGRFHRDGLLIRHGLICIAVEQQHGWRPARNIAIGDAAV